MSFVVNTHLHSGLERDAFFRQRIAETQERGRLRPEDVGDLVAVFEEGQRRRLNEARRIDFLFVMRDSPAGRGGCLRQELFGQSPEVTVEPGSDHYGVLVTYLADSSSC
jgi:hypothetical protein